MQGGSFIKHFLILSAGTLANMLLALLTTPIITRMVDPAYYGSYSLFSTYGTLALSVAGLGLDSTLVRYFYIEENDEYRAALLRFCYILPNLAFSALIAAAILILLIFRRDLVSMDNACLAGAFAIFVVILILNRTSSLVLRLHYNTKRLAWTSVLNKAVFAALAIAGLWLSGGEYGFPILVFALLVGYLVVTTYQILPERAIWHDAVFGKLVFQAWKEGLKYGLPFVAASAAGSFLGSAGQVFLGAFATTADVGIYAAALTISHIFAIIQSSFNTLWAPASIERYEKDPEEREVYIRAHKVMALVMISMGLLFILFKDVIVFLLGSGYRGASIALPFLCLQPVYYTLSETTVCGMVFMKRSDYQLYSSLIACGSCALLCWILVPVLGVRGAAIATGVSYVVFFCTRTLFSNLVFPISFNLGRLSIASFMLLAYCVWATFFAFSIAMVFYYLVAQTVVLVLYKDSLGDVLNMVRGLAGKFRRLDSEP